MKRLIILLFASLVTVGLLIACSNPSAQPMDGNGNGNGNGNGDMVDPDPDPTPPMPADLVLTLEGWTDRSDTANAGTFTWTLEVDDAGAGGVDTKLELEFTDGGTDLTVEAAATTAATDAAACTGLTDLDVEISGLTISFSGEVTATGCTLIANYDPDGSGDAPARAITGDGTDDDDLAFEITLAEAPMTEPVASGDYKDQDIDVTGTVMVTGTEDDAETVTYNISGTVTYMPPTITTQKAN
ncbi:MAG: hypothetical protein OXM87_00655 [Truepera sp.]|nr:hypothetical protein [Truepera sp.]